MPISVLERVLLTDDASLIKAVPNRDALTERLMNLRQSGLRSQTSFLLARTSTGGSIDHLAQCLPIAGDSAEQLDKSLLDGVQNVVNIDPDGAISGPDLGGMAGWI